MVARGGGARSGGRGARRLGVFCADRAAAAAASTAPAPSAASVAVKCTAPTSPDAEATVKPSRDAASVAASVVGSRPPHSPPPAWQVMPPTLSVTDRARVCLSKRGGESNSSWAAGRVRRATGFAPSSSPSTTTCPSVTCTGSLGSTAAAATSAGRARARTRVVVTAPSHDAPRARRGDRGDRGDRGGGGAAPAARRRVMVKPRTIRGARGGRPPAAGCSDRSSDSSARATRATGPRASVSVAPRTHRKPTESAASENEGDLARAVTARPSRLWG